MNLLIPTIMLLAMIVISYKMYRERKEETIVTVDEIVLTDEQMFIIEQKAQIAKRDYAPHWRMQYRGSFNLAKYVEFLEYKCSKGEL